ncbi:hypothetical protein [Acinetobacter sp. MD2(2019)]|uniref:hypothetical protein n=1 Tax=Acinetobacter sp. MD2(2019) TaxID=2605273 RepID=UPI002D1F31C8|nr:hypothetical protein [Acinetobacter sp. MD2(2019)]MEB3754794.1 hypothetical protein [Acinetobacter sp. MD2(2019)]
MNKLLLLFPILLLCIFTTIGCVGLYFAIQYPENVPFYAWIILLIFAILPLIILYGLFFGFPVSEKQWQEQEKIRKKLSFDENGMTIEMPLFDKSCFIDWQSIQKIIYYNYVVSSDFTEHYQGFKFYLNTVPTYTKHQKQWWLNRLFPKDSSSKMIDIHERLSRTA